MLASPTGAVLAWIAGERPVPLGVHQIGARRSHDRPRSDRDQDRRVSRSDVIRERVEQAARRSGSTTDEEPQDHQPRPENGQEHVGRTEYVEQSVEQVVRSLDLDDEESGFRHENRKARARFLERNDLVGRDDQDEERQEDHRQEKCSVSQNERRIEEM